MRVIDYALWIAAVPVWCALAFIVGVYFFEAVLAAVACASWHRWAWLEVKRRGVKWPWRSFPKSVFKMWWVLLGHRNGNNVWHTKLCAEWRGIGDWTLGTALKVPGEE